jgi:hypothetical protein
VLFRRTATEAEQDTAVPECGNAKLFEVLGGEAREDPLVDLFVAECRLVLFEAKAPQPEHNVHDGVPQSTQTHDRPNGNGCPDALIRPLKKA